MPHDALIRKTARSRLRFELERGYWMLTRVHLPMEPLDDQK